MRPDGLSIPHACRYAHLRGCRTISHRRMHVARFTTAIKNMFKQRQTVNEAGGAAFQKTPEEELTDMLLVSKLTGGFYRPESKELKRLRELVNSVDPEFAARAALYARWVMGLRTVTHVVAGELGKRVTGKQWTKGFFSTIVRRPDDMREIAAYTFGGGRRNALRRGRNGHSLPKAMQKGFAKALTRFDAYQLGSHRGEGSDLPLVDLVRLVHPRPTPALTALVAGELRSQKHDAALTKAGQQATDEADKAELKARAWEEQLGRMGYNALVLNLRNIATQAPQLTEQAAARVEDAQAVRRSLILPMQLWQAGRVLDELGTREANRLNRALGKAIDLACQNVPELSGRTLVAIDTSGSMHWVANRGDFKGQPLVDAACMFGAVLAKAAAADVICFATQARYVGYNANDTVLTLAKRFKGCICGGTNFHAVFNLMQKRNNRYDRVFVLSDMQGWLGGRVAAQQSLNRYKRKCGAAAMRLYSIDLAGYSSTQFLDGGVTQLAGIGFGIFDLVRMTESDRNALVREIDTVEFTETWTNQARKRQWK